MRKHSTNDAMSVVMSRSVLNEETGCLEWSGCKDQKGYGKVRFDGKMIRIHRFVWRVHNGQIPSGGHILHKCDNPSCCNLEQLFLGSNSENIADKVSKDRASKKLTAEQALEIRAMTKNKMCQRVIAEKFGINPSTVSRIGSGLRRQYLEGRV